MSVFWCRPPGRRRRRRGGAGAGAGGKRAICSFLLTLAVAHIALVATTTARRPRVCLHTLERVRWIARAGRGGDDDASPAITYDDATRNHTSNLGSRACAWQSLPPDRAARALADEWVLFVGDSQVRETFRALVRLLFAAVPPQDRTRTNAKFAKPEDVVGKRDLAVGPSHIRSFAEQLRRGDNVSASSPVLNIGTLPCGAGAAFLSRQFSKDVEQVVHRASKLRRPPAAVVAGVGLWHMLYVHDAPKFARVRAGVLRELATYARASRPQRSLALWLEPPVPNGTQVRANATAASLKRVRFTRQASHAYSLRRVGDDDPAVVRLSLRRVAYVHGCRPGAAVSVHGTKRCLTDGVHLAPYLYDAAAHALLAALEELLVNVKAARRSHRNVDVDDDNDDNNGGGVCTVT